jgi:hypothetical protein
LIRTPARDLDFFYFENRAKQALTSGWKPNTLYQFTWFDSRSGKWS